MVPEILPTSLGATAGEQRVFKMLRDALRPHEDFIAWYEPKTLKKRPDFIVWSKTWGLIIIEVKDWTLSQVRTSNPDQWKIMRKDVETTCESPTEQARRCFLNYKEAIQQSPLLRQQDGRNVGRIKFPIGYCVIFTRITRKQATDAGISSSLGSTYCFFSDDLSDQPLSENSRLVFLIKLRQAFVIWFPFTALNSKEMQTLRTLIFPEVRIRNMRHEPVHSLRPNNETEEMRSLDLEQERTAKGIPEGHRILKGVAGSGKTLVLSCRARYLKKVQPEWRILLVCFNISLCQYIRQLLAGTDSNSNDSGIDVYHYHGLVKTLTAANLGKLPAEASDDWNKRIGTTFREAITSGLVKTRYDAVLIDEGQDFAPEWLHSLTALLNPASDSLLLCLDPAQNIFGRKITFKSVGIKVVGKRPLLLKTSYRNTKEILSLARSFAKTKDLMIDPDSDAANSSELFPLCIDRSGPPPKILSDLSPPAQIDFILDTISSHIEAEECDWCDIGVLYASHHADFAARFSFSFHREFGRDKLYWVSENRQSKSDLNLGSPAVKLSTIESAKGMEFRLIFMVGLESLPRSDRDETTERKLVYVGLTRAQDLLYVLGDQRKGFLQELIETHTATAAI